MINQESISNTSSDQQEAARVQEIISRCTDEVVEILKKYECDLFVSTVLEPPNQIKHFIRVVPKFVNLETKKDK